MAIISREAGIIKIVGSGFPSFEIVQRHFDQLDTILQAERRNGRTVIVLVDLRDGVTSPLDLAEYINMRTKTTYHDEDRVAIIVKSSLLRMQLKRIHVGKNFGIFLDEPEALEFLAGSG